MACPFSSKLPYIAYHAADHCVLSGMTSTDSSLAGTSIPFQLNPVSQIYSHHLLGRALSVLHSHPSTCAPRCQMLMVGRGLLSHIAHAEWPAAEPEQSKLQAERRHTQLAISQCLCLCLFLIMTLLRDIVFIGVRICLCLCDQEAILVDFVMLV